jgi:hypothetical protein
MGDIFGKERPIMFNERRTLNISYDGTTPPDTKLNKPSNFIRTAKYTPITFLPKSLLA